MKTEPENFSALNQSGDDLDMIIGFLNHKAQNKKKLTSPVHQSGGALKTALTQPIELTCKTKPQTSGDYPSNFKRAPLPLPSSQLDKTPLSTDNSNTIFMPAGPKTANESSRNKINGTKHSSITTGPCEQQKQRIDFLIRKSSAKVIGNRRKKPTSVNQ